MVPHAGDIDHILLLGMLTHHDHNNNGIMFHVVV